MRPLAKALVPWNRGFRGLVPCLLLTSCSAPAPIIIGSPSWAAKSWVFGVQQDGAADLQLTARADDSEPLRIRNANLNYMVNTSQQIFDFIMSPVDKNGSGKLLATT